MLPFVNLIHLGLSAFSSVISNFELLRVNAVSVGISYMRQLGKNGTSVFLCSDTFFVAKVN